MATLHLTTQEATPPRVSLSPCLRLSLSARLIPLHTPRPSSSCSPVADHPDSDGAAAAPAWTDTWQRERQNEEVITRETLKERRLKTRMMRREKYKSDEEMQQNGLQNSEATTVNK